MDWLRQFPKFRFTRWPDEWFQLIDRGDLEHRLKDVDQESIEKIITDLDFLDYELLRLFRDRDFRAKQAQNEHRRVQIVFIFLAAVATMIGSLQALTLSGNTHLVPYFSFMETLVALFTTYIATTASRRSGDRWYTNRSRAEYLRREYFRYLLLASPYDQMDAKERRRTLSLRAAEINRGVFPEHERTPKT